MPEDAAPNQKYCNPGCRKLSQKARDRETAPRTNQERAVAKRTRKAKDTMANLRQLVKFAGVDDPSLVLREVLQDVIRDNLTLHVQDNLLGAGEALTALLPRVLAGIANDLESKDWMIRSRAQAAVLKYAFEFKEKGGQDKDLGVISVVHNVAIPNTPLGQQMDADIIDIQEEQLQLASEGYERDWPRCVQCGEPKHPDTVLFHAGSALCSSCRLKTRLADPSAIHVSNSPGL